MTDRPKSQDDGPDVLGPAKKLAQILHKDPKSLDQITYDRGDDLLTLFSDEIYGKRLDDLAKLKIEAIQQAIDDLAARGKILVAACFGVTYLEDEEQVQLFITPYEETPSGSILFKIGLRDVEAFKAWRNGNLDQLDEEDINAAIYRLTAEWATLL